MQAQRERERSRSGGEEASAHRQQRGPGASSGAWEAQTTANETLADATKPRESERALRVSRLYAQAAFRLRRRLCLFTSASRRCIRARDSLLSSAGRYRGESRSIVDRRAFSRVLELSGKLSRPVSTLNYL